MEGKNGLLFSGTVCLFSPEQILYFGNELLFFRNGLPFSPDLNRDFASAWPEMFRAPRHVGPRVALFFGQRIILTGDVEQRFQGRESRA